MSTQEIETKVPETSTEVSKGTKRCSDVYEDRRAFIVEMERNKRLHAMRKVLSDDAIKEIAVVFPTYMNCQFESEKYKSTPFVVQLDLKTKEPKIYLKETDKEFPIFAWAAKIGIECEQGTDYFPAGNTALLISDKVTLENLKEQFLQYVREGYEIPMPSSSSDESDNSDDEEDSDDSDDDDDDDDEDSDDDDDDEDSDDDDDKD